MLNISVKGGWGRLFEGGDYVKYFRQRWVGAIIRGRRLIKGRLLFEEIQYLKVFNVDNEME